MDIKDVWCRDWRAKPKKGDYFNDDGLLVCGRCHKPRECILDLWHGGDAYKDAPKRYVVRPIACDCKPRKETAQDNVLAIGYKDLMKQVFGKDVESEEDMNELK